MRNKLYSAGYLVQTLGARPSRHPTANFGGADDALWFWVNTGGARRSNRLRQCVPRLPKGGIQIGTTGLQGDAALRQAHSFYRLIKQSADRWHPGGYAACSDAIDYGCGWGRITRFFVKDFEPGRLTGIDCLPVVIEAAASTNPWCEFRLVDPLPPSGLPAGSADLIFAYSVFSHLSEGAHLEWLDEFHRLLRPGGLAVLTTRPWVWFEQYVRERGDSADDWTSRFAAGEFCHIPTGSPSGLDPSQYGESAISETYASRTWSKWFDVVDWIDDPKRCDQTAAVLRRVND